MPDHPPSTVAFSNRQSQPVDETGLTALAQETLAREGITGAELSLSLVTANEIAELHERYLHEPGPTDVLSFPQDDDAPNGHPRVLGDVVVCVEVAAKQNTDLESELRLLIVHGILHLLGYDHETDEDRTEMWRRQARYSGVQVPASGEREIPA